MGHCRTMEIPESLQHRIDLFKETGRVFKVPTELFGENSWTQVMLGQGLSPEQYHPIVNMMDEQELRDFLGGIHGSVERFDSKDNSGKPSSDIGVEERGEEVLEEEVVDEEKE